MWADSMYKLLSPGTLADGCGCRFLGTHFVRGYERLLRTLFGRSYERFAILFWGTRLDDPLLFLRFSVEPNGLSLLLFLSLHSMLSKEQETNDLY